MVRNVPVLVRALPWLLAIPLVFNLIGCGGKHGGKGEARGYRGGNNDNAAGKGHNTEAYDRIVDNPILSARAEPQSTFSIDVDTASYSNVRRFLLQENKMPPKDAVRIEEMINYFRYDYAEPQGPDPISINTELASCPWNANHKLLRIGLRGRSLDKTPARNLVFLIDVSGSMNDDNKLPLVKRSLTMLAGQLTENDRVAIVVYASASGEVLPSTPGNKRREILAALDRLEAGGSTNGGQGIQLAYTIARRNFIENGINRVILATDGDFNVGVTSQGDLLSMIERERKSGVFLTVLGYGMGNLKDSTLEKLADHGNGHYAYIDSEDEARKVFVEEAGALVTIAKDVKVQVEFNPKHVGGYRLIGYENRLLAARDFADDTKDAGDMGCGHNVTALYEIIPPEHMKDVPAPGELKYQENRGLTKNADSDELATVRFRYKDPTAETSKELVRAIAKESVDFTAASADTRFAASVASFGMLLRGSEHKGDASYGKVADWAFRSLDKDPNGHRAKFLEMVRAADRMNGS